MNRSAGWLAALSLLVLLAVSCGGGGGSTNTGLTGTPISAADLTGSCALRLLALSTPGAILPDQHSTVLAGIYTFDGRGGLGGDVASNGVTANGFATVTGSYNLNQQGLGTITVNQAGQPYAINFVTDETLDTLALTGQAGGAVVIGVCQF